MKADGTVAQTDDERVSESGPNDDGVVHRDEAEPPDPQRIRAAPDNDVGQALVVGEHADGSTGSGARSQLNRGDRERLTVDGTEDPKRRAGKARRIWSDPGAAHPSRGNGIGPGDAAMHG